MDCTQAREYLSAQLDNQLDPGDASRLEAHVETCDDCEAWGREIAGMTRRYRVGPAGTRPPGRPVDPPRAGRNRMLRLALGWLGLLLIAWHLQALFASGTGSTVHLERHQAGFAVALGIGLLVVAVRPDRAYGVRPLATALMAVLVVAVIIDVVQGSTPLSAELRHLAEIGGLALLWLLGHEMGPGRVSPETTDHSLISGFRRRHVE